MSKKRAKKSAAWQPIRARVMWRVDQVFLGYSGQRIQVAVHLVSDRGQLKNEVIVAPTANPTEAVRFAAFHVGRRGDVTVPHSWIRIRWAVARAHSEQDELVRDPELEQQFREGLEDSLEALRDQMR